MLLLLILVLPVYSLPIIDLGLNNGGGWDAVPTAPVPPPPLPISNILAPIVTPIQYTPSSVPWLGPVYPSVPGLGPVYPQPGLGVDTPIVQVPQQPFIYTPPLVTYIPPAIVPQPQVISIPPQTGLQLLPPVFQQSTLQSVAQPPPITFQKAN